MTPDLRTLRRNLERMRVPCPACEGVSLEEYAPCHTCVGEGTIPDPRAVKALDILDSLESVLPRFTGLILSFGLRLSKRQAGWLITGALINIGNTLGVVLPRSNVYDILAMLEQATAPKA